MMNKQSKPWARNKRHYRQMMHSSKQPQHVSCCKPWQRVGSRAQGWSVPCPAAAPVAARQARAEPQSQEPSPAADRAPAGTPARGTKKHTTKDKNHIIAFALLHLVMQGTWTHGSRMLWTMGDAASILDVLFHQQLPKDRRSQCTRDLWLLAQHSPGDPLQVQLCPEDALKLAVSQACPNSKKTQKQRWLQASHCLN